ncbi:50S ribosomal protein L4 [Candidatus Brocadiaceae bacterium S225]|uniref:Large ribosomal subunit protein uL4 n=1 Tax=Candidatus Scalindua brodae TaxID=237368 RepID=A0A0B0EI45_9BACT|nr:MAG: 50S ribosomal protein L4 [Candidatus Scalindua brodae]TWU36881.1 50S ribosomal protein L4 [Candidatus Brocadiaceae bacterium S225]
MIKVPVFDNSGNSLEDVTLSEETFGGKVRRELLRDTIIMHEANHRKGTASTKTRGEVAGGGRKPWKQKHTGRARAGDIRSPIWKGGGVVFGPKPRDYSFSLNRKAKRVALQTAILSRLIDNEVVLIDKLELDLPSTKKLASILKCLEIRESCLIVMQEFDETIWKSSRNIYNVKFRVASDLNAYDVVKYKKLLIVKDVLENLKFE